MIMDFGLSHISKIERSVVTGKTGVRGSWRWFSPEVFNRIDEDVDIHTKESDIWALGMTYLVSCFRCSFALKMLSLSNTHNSL